MSLFALHTFWIRASDFSDIIVDGTSFRCKLQWQADEHGSARKQDLHVA